MIKKALLIYSPLTGKNKAIKEHKMIVKKLSSKYEITSFLVDSNSSLEEQIKSAFKKYDYLFICGGDGTLNLIINIVSKLPKEERLPIGYIPCGTMNDAGKTYGVSSIKKAIKILLDENIDKVDVGRINDRYFFYLLAIGQYSDISYLAKRPDKKKLGKFAYYDLAVKEAFQKKRISLDISLEEKSKNYVVPFVLIMNGKYAGGFKVNRAHNPNNGLLDMYLTKPGLFNGLTHYFPFKTKTEHVQFKEARIVANTSMPWCVDGEKYECDVANIECLNEHISFFTKSSKR